MGCDECPDQPGGSCQVLNPGTLSETVQREEGSFDTKLVLDGSINLGWRFVENPRTLKWFWNPLDLEMIRKFLRLLTARQFGFFDWL